MMNRPEFDDIKDYDEFCKYYWYRDELIKICKAHGLKAPSGKIELNKVIEIWNWRASHKRDTRWHCR